MIEIFITALTPIIIAGVTQLIKKFTVTPFLTSEFRKSALRFVVGVLSFSVVVIETQMMGGEVDPVSIETFAETLKAFLGATGIYLLTRSKTERTTLPTNNFNKLEGK